MPGAELIHRLTVVNWRCSRLLGVVQGLTEFLPGLVDRAPAARRAAARVSTIPAGVFAVTIQLGSILAIVWLYRAKILRVLAGLPSDPRRAISC